MVVAFYLENVIQISYADEDKGETQIKQPYQCSEVQTGANDIVSEVTNIETHTSQYGQKVDQLMESILEENDEVHDQACNKKGQNLLVILEPE